MLRFQRPLTLGRVASAGDNAAMESFFALLQNNVLDRHTWKTREDLTVAIISWIETTYHRRRRQRGLGRMTPIEFETAMTHHTAIAARPLRQPVNQSLRRPI
jgi:transposase InsO family protein